MVTNFCRIALFALSLISGSLPLYSIPCLPGGTDPVDTIDVVVDAPGSDDNPLPYRKSTWHVQESIWPSAAGTTMFLDPQAFSINGTGGGIDQTSWASVVDLLSVEGIRRSVEAGYVGPGDIVKVRTPACVSRSGSGATTRFFPCGPDCCTRTYLVLTPLPGTLLILPLLEDISVCDPVPEGCEQGCNGLLPVP